MGKAARWLRGLLQGGKTPGGSPVPAEDPKPRKEKKRWGFARSFRDKERGAVHRKEPVAESVLKERNTSYREVPRSHVSAVGSATPTVSVTGSSPFLAAGENYEDEQNKRAIAVAAATAAVAEAAVAAAQAAAAVVRLTSSGRSAKAYDSGRKYEEWSAVKIQSVFRGYLARRALKALKGLVKLQALVRGHIVRKQAAQTLRCMQSLVRVQARARACRVLPEYSQHKKRFWPPHPVPPTPEKYEVAACKKGTKLGTPGILKKNASKSGHADVVNPDKMHSGWNWLDQWMGDRLEATARTGVGTDDEKNDRILEIDTGKPHSNLKRRNNNNQSSCSPLGSDQNSRSFATVPESPSKDSTTAQFSTPSPSTVDMRRSLSPLSFSIEAGDLYESPQFISSSRPGSTRRGAFTPAKSECSQSIISAYSDYPNYMSYTESSKAKVRSQSAPKQRPDFVERLPVQGLGAGGHVVQLSSSSSQMLSSTSTHLKFTSKAYPGSGRLDRLGMPIGI